MSKWGPIIRDLMKAKRVTQRELEAVSGVSRSTIKRCLHGKSSPRIDVVEKLLSTFGYSISMNLTAEPSEMLRKQQMRFVGHDASLRKLIKAVGCDRGY